MSRARSNSLCRQLGAALTVAAALCAAAIPATAGAATQARAGCPPPYLVHNPGTHSLEEIDDARQGRFKVHRATVKLDPPVNWALDPYHSRRFRGDLNSLGFLDVLFFDYRTNAKRASLRKARDLALDWIQANPLSNPATDRSWDDRISASRATFIAYAMRASRCEGLLRKRTEHRLSESLAQHGRRAASPRLYRATNHGLFVDTNLILLARSVPSISEGKGWVKRGKRRFKRTLDGRMIESEGFWLEHSTGYQHAIREEVAYYRDLVVDGGLGGLLNRMTDVSGWLIEPDGEAVLLGASNHKPLNSEIEAAAADDDGMLWLPRSGLAVIKAPGAFLSTYATFFNGSHKHSDELSFDLYDQGRRIVTDSGLYDQDRGRWSRFGASAPAHSTLTVDGKRFSQNPDDAYGSGMLARGAGAGWFATLGRNPLVRSQGVDHRRLLLYRPGLGVIVVDRVRSSRPHTYRRLFQIGSDLDAAEQAGAVVLSDGGWSGRIEDATAGENTGVSLARGQTQGKLRGFEFPTFRTRVPRWTAMMTTQGEDVDHLAAVGVNPVQSLEGELELAGRRRTTLKLNVSGAPAGTLEVVRHGGSLDVELIP